MWNSRCGLGVTIAVLYALALIGSIILLIRHGRPRRAWICLGLLSLGEYKFSGDDRLR